MKLFVIVNVDALVEIPPPLLPNIDDRDTVSVPVETTPAPVFPEIVDSEMVAVPPFTEMPAPAFPESFARTIVTVAVLPGWTEIPGLFAPDRKSTRLNSSHR